MIQTKHTSGTIGFLGLLTLIFIILKLTGYIDWNWWWVLVPLWGPPTTICGVVIVTFVVLVFLKVVDELSKR